MQRLVEHDGFALLVDPGHETMPRLMEYVAPADVDAVLVTHGHADHCADLNALLNLDGLMLADDWTLTELWSD